MRIFNRTVPLPLLPPAHILSELMNTRMYILLDTEVDILFT